MSIENGYLDPPRYSPRYGIPDGYEELTGEKGRMNPVIKTMWTTALRSGDYKQGNGFLTVIKPDGSEEDCCLGVLNKLGHVPSKPEFLINPEENEEVTVLAYTGGGYDNKGTLDTNFAVNCGFANGNPFLPGLFDRENRMMDATTLNDEGLPFDQIADLIDYFL